MPLLRHTFKLVGFESGDKWIAGKASDSDLLAEREPAKEQVFTITLYGISYGAGRTYSVMVTGFQPYFYVRVPDTWRNAEVGEFVGAIRSELGRFDSHLMPTGLVRRKTLYGFDADTPHQFVKLSFRTESAYKCARYMWQACATSRFDCYTHDGDDTFLYETQLPPLLRFFHVRDISPSGWVTVAVNRNSIPKKRESTCQHEFVVDESKVTPLLSSPSSSIDVDSPAPYKMCSWDIEASSSHGDFPLATKTYRRLAEELADLKDDDAVLDAESVLGILEQALGVAPIDERELVSRIYTGVELTQGQLARLTKRLLTLVPSTIEPRPSDFDLDDQEESDDEADGPSVGEATEGGPKKRCYGSIYKGGDVLTLLNDPKVTRRMVVQELTRMFAAAGFPRVQGDKVTFIGSCFMRYGEDEPYLNHCLVLGSCDVPNTKNVHIECCTSERQLLLRWKELLVKQDPDILLGYNIFGFDWPFLYARASECGCLNEFLQLSRKKNHICFSRNRDPKTNSWSNGLATTSVHLASGPHEMHYPQLHGRLQIDLYPAFRRDFQLPQYKLDYVAGYFIGDMISAWRSDGASTVVEGGNLFGLKPGDYIVFEIHAHAVELYCDGAKYRVRDIDHDSGSFVVDTVLDVAEGAKLRWALGKDDVGPQDIFRLSRGDSADRAVVAKYCLQDCLLVLDLFRKVDMLTGFIEMAALCSVPLEFLILRGQGVKLTSYLGKKCRGWASDGVLMPTLSRRIGDEAYEGAIVLAPKRGLYMNDPVACVDYSSLYPSSMLSENISHDSKVCTIQYNLEGDVVERCGAQNDDGEFIYDNLPDYQYVDITYDTYEWRRKTANPRSAMEKVRTGRRTCRFAQYPNGARGVLPAVLAELLAERKRVRKLAKTESNAFMRNVLDKRQLSIKVTANSLYGGCGAKTSHFYDIDCAAATTAIGRKLLNYARSVIEDGYAGARMTSATHGDVIVNPEYVYGDTDSVFFRLNPSSLTGEKIIGQQALDLTIELAPEIGASATRHLKPPHDLEYEKTFYPFCLLAKKRYAGVLYENDPLSGKRKSMGIVLNRRDNAPIVKDIYGGILDILLSQRNVPAAVEFLRNALSALMQGRCPVDKLVITKALRSGYKNPKQIAHNVLARRIGKREPGAKPRPGERVPFIYIQAATPKALQGDRIETPSYIQAEGLEIDYAFYVTNQLMKPLQQVFAIVLEDIPAFRAKKGHSDLRKWRAQLRELDEKYPDPDVRTHKEDLLRAREVKALLFDPALKPE